jgi:SAM-dependent methyltransferase
MSEKNVEHWTKANADFTDAEARRAWVEHEFSWGMWARPDAELGILGDGSGLDAVELGCGTAYDSARLARSGAMVVGVDPTPAQLDTARRMQAEFGLDFPLIQAFAEDVPLPDASFDLVHSEYGASSDQFWLLSSCTRRTAPSRTSTTPSSLPTGHRNGPPRRYGRRGSSARGCGAW